MSRPSFILTVRCGCVGSNCLIFAVSKHVLERQDLRLLQVSVYEADHIYDCTFRTRESYILYAFAGQ